MDLITILESRLQALAPGDYTTGLNAVVQHINAATAHLSRGDREADFGAYTDAVYRCNQAFEGSLKECYRALTGQDPDRKTPHEIEQYLENQGVLRERVLSQITTYRQDWRNPSTHDYKLDFDASEALLAIASIYALAIALVDQVVFALGSAGGSQNALSVGDQAQPLFDRVLLALSTFSLGEPASTSAGMRAREAEGALVGHLSAALPDAQVNIQVSYDADGFVYRPDIVVEHEADKIVIELKAMRKRTLKLVQSGLAQLQKYVVVAKATGGVLMIVADEVHEKRSREEGHLTFANGVEVVVLGPAGTSRAVEQAAAAVGAMPRS